MLLRRLRRGLSFVESVGSLGNDAALVRRGLPKFFDIDAQAISCSLGELEGCQSSKHVSRAWSSSFGFAEWGLRATLGQGLTRLLEDRTVC